MDEGRNSNSFVRMSVFSIVFLGGVRDQSGSVSSSLSWFRTACLQSKWDYVGGSFSSAQFLKDYTSRRT